MRWSVYAVAILIAASLDASVGSLFAVGELRGQFLPAVVVFALLAAPRKFGVRIAMLGGLVADLLSPVVLPTQEVLIVPGPRALGFALGALAVIQLRSLLYRQNPLAGSAATFVFSLLAAVVFVFVFSIRSLVLDGGAPWWPGSGSGEVWRRFLGAIGDGILALPTLWLLGKTRSIWAFTTATRVSPGLARQSG
jgi:cell shape-determining protein MreD